MSENFDDFRKKIFFVKRQDEYVAEHDEETINTPPSLQTQISVVSPSNYEGAKMYAEELRNGNTVIVCFDKLSAEDKQRAYDYLNGVAYMLNSDISVVTPNVLVYSPVNVTTERLYLGANSRR